MKSISNLSSCLFAKLCAVDEVNIIFIVKKIVIYQFFFKVYLRDNLFIQTRPISIKHQSQDTEQ